MSEPRRSLASGYTTWSSRHCTGTVQNYERLLQVA